MTKLKRYRGITKDIAEQKLKLWLDAENAVALSQSYTIEGRSLTRANLSEIRQMIEYWGNIVDKFDTDNASGIRIQRIIPKDF